MTQELDYIGQLEQDAAKASGGGGIIGQCELNRGFKVFVAGLGNRESFFAYAAGNDTARKAAEGKAKAASGGSKVQDCIELVITKASVKGKEVTWKYDRFFTFPLWTQGFKEIVLPSIKEHKPPLGKKFWAKVSFIADPSGRTKADQNGEVKPELVAFIAQVYKDEAEAISDAGGASNGTEPEAVDAMVPTAYSKSDWYGLKDSVSEKMSLATTSAASANKGKPAPIVTKAVANAKTQALKDLAKEYEATEEQVLHLLNSQ